MHGFGQKLVLKNLVLKISIKNLISDQKLDQNSLFKDKIDLYS